ncbi:hypothetical protein GCM10028773_64280 [Spirosoma koreense]
MIICFDVIDGNRESRQFICDVSRLEVGLNLINYAVGQGHLVLKVDLIHEDRQLTLPIDVFDGLKVPITRQLAWEWLMSNHVN